MGRFASARVWIQENDVSQADGPRLHVPATAWARDGEAFALPEGAARHVQVLRLQPGDGLRLFDGEGQERQATVTEMGRKLVSVRLGAQVPNARELPCRVTLVVGMPANDRMDALVEKATELGVHALQPVVCTRSVLRLDGERAARKVAHWQAVAVAASEQCGRAVVPRVLPVRPLDAWLRDATALPAGSRRGVLSLREARPLMDWVANAVPGSCELGSDWCFLNGPEGGLTAEEEGLALGLDWQAISLGPRVLRADTAPLAALSVIAAVSGR